MEEENKNNGRMKCRIWSRVCGYLRPTATWNEGKLAEFEDRKTFLPLFELPIEHCGKIVGSQTIKNANNSEDKE